MNRRASLLLIAGGALACTKRGGDARIETLDLEGVKARLARAKGKVAVVHFWATWCGPCLEELPILARLHKSIADDPRIDFFAVAVAEENPLEVARWMSESRARFQTYIAETDDAGGFTDGIDPKWGGILPTTLVYAPDGTLTIRNIGPVEDPGDFLAQLVALAKA